MKLSNLLIKKKSCWIKEMTYRLKIVLSVSNEHFVLQSVISVDVQTLLWGWRASSLALSLL